MAAVVASLFYGYSCFPLLYNKLWQAVPLTTVRAIADRTMQDNDPMLYRFEGELFVGPGIGFFGERLNCELWASADELFIDTPRKATGGRPMAHFLDQRFKRGQVRLHYPARLWLLNIGIRIHAGNLAANRIAVFIPGPLETPDEIFARLDALGWGKEHAVGSASSSATAVGG